MRAFLADGCVDARPIDDPRANEIAVEAIQGASNL
jgi:hypothetical protein